MNNDLMERAFDTMDRRTNRRTHTFLKPFDLGYFYLLSRLYRYCVKANIQDVCVGCTDKLIHTFSC